jgi:hypothetical protein
MNTTPDTAAEGRPDHGPLRGHTGASSFPLVGHDDFAAERILREKRGAGVTTNLHSRPTTP